MRRLPILLWGDLMRGGRPVLRRALAGRNAHECMYAWVYLTDFLAHRRLLELPPGKNLLAELDSGELWRRVERAALDPHFQLSKDGFEAVAQLAALAVGAGEPQPLLVELGSTFFASKTKLEILNRIAGEALEPEWIGIDNSRFMHDTTRALHGDGAVRLLDDYRKLAPPQSFAGFLSRFVASYVFPGGTAFADYLAERFQAAVIEDAYSTTARDEPVHNHGQAEIFFSLPATFGRLEERGFEIRLLDAYPDFPAGAARCHVIRYLATRKGVANARSAAWLSALGFQAGDVRPAATLLDELNAAVPAGRWSAVERAKRESPVWGRTPEASERPSWAARLRARLARAPWRRYRLGGSAALREIDRALDEEQSGR